MKTLHSFIQSTKGYLYVMFRYKILFSFSFITKTNLILIISNKHSNKFVSPLFTYQVSNISTRIFVSFIHNVINIWSANAKSASILKFLQHFQFWHWVWILRNKKRIFNFYKTKLYNFNLCKDTAKLPVLICWTLNASYMLSQRCDAYSRVEHQGEYKPLCTDVIELQSLDLPNKYIHEIYL